MLRSFLGSRPKGSGSSHSLSSIEESQNLEDAMRGVLYIMDDRVDKAEEHLAKGNSPFHVLGRGLSMFFRATLGFEQDVMREAADKLNEAETIAAEHQRRVQKHPETSQASIYPPGTEYALVIAEAQLMGAVLAVLNESLTEGIRGFYKLRKAYITLSGILDAEKRYVERHGSTGSGTPQSASQPATPVGPSASASKEMLAATEKLALKDDADEFVDAPEDVKSTETPPTYQGHLGADPPADAAAAAKENGGDGAAAGARLAPLVRAPTGVEEGPDHTLFASNPVDEFIHAGSNLNFGVLLLLISIIPPAFAMLLKIVGFRGDRDRGLALLWQATKSAQNNIHGALAGLVLCGYYNAVIGFCDIVPADAYPRERCAALLGAMRARFPRSRLWLLEEVRALAKERQLEKAVELVRESGESPLKQVEALQWFERSLDCMYMHDYAGASEGFQTCVGLNNWSHALYYYIAGAASVELYRQARTTGDEAAMKQYGEQATTLLRQVPAHTGKKRFMARQLPFDVFVSRKLVKWEERAKAWGVEFVEAVGVSPLEEMIFFWNGYNRMRPEHLDKSLEMLAWSESAANAGQWARETLDERAVLALLRATCTRNLGRRGEAKEILQREILEHEWHEFKGGHKDNWTCPIAHYEMAINLWQERDGSEADDARLRECSQWLEKVASWESYDLDARMGMRVTTARETLKKAGVGAGAGGIGGGGRAVGLMG